MAWRFNVPPGWPPLPTPDWRPPPGWVPDPTWPAPPPGWTFYIDDRAARGRVGWVQSLLPVVAVFWVLGWLFLSSMGIFFVDSCQWQPAEASARCGSRLNTALLVMAIAQVSVLLLVPVCYLIWRRWLVGVIVAVVGAPLVFIVFYVAADLIVKAG